MKPVTVKPVEYKNNQDIIINNEPPISGWELHHVTESSYRIITYTVVAVTAVVTRVAQAAEGATIIMLAAIVNHIIQDHIERIWYRTNWYCKWRKWPVLWEIVAERNWTRHFSDSNRTKLEGVTESEYWL